MKHESHANKIHIHMDETVQTVDWYPKASHSSVAILENVLFYLISVRTFRAHVSLKNTFDHANYGLEFDQEI